MEPAAWVFGSMLGDIVVPNRRYHRANCDIYKKLKRRAKMGYNMNLLNNIKYMEFCATEMIEKYSDWKKHHLRQVLTYYSICSPIQNISELDLYQDKVLHVKQESLAEIRTDHEKNARGHSVVFLLLSIIKMSRKQDKGPIVLILSVLLNSSWWGRQDQALERTRWIWHRPHMLLYD